MENWNFRKPIIVGEFGVANIVLAYEPGMKADFSDVRFVTGDGLEFLDYRRASFVSGVTATFHVAVAEAKIYCIFGNPLAVYESTWTAPVSVLKTIDHETGFVKHASNPIIPLGASGQWDDYFVYGVAPYEEAGTIYLFYSGMRNVGANPRLEGSIGLSTSTDGGVTFVKQGKLVDRGDVPDLGITPFDVKKIGSTYYMFCTIFNSGSTTYKLCYLTSTDLLNWSNYTPITGVDSSAHGPCVIDDPSDPTKLIMYYTGNMLTTPCIKRVTANKSNPASWSGNTTVFAGTSLYPSVRYTGTHYEMFVAVLLSGGGYSTYKTVSADGLSFQPTDLIPVPNGPSGSWDQGYITCPRIIGDKLFYSARKSGGLGYEGIGMASLSNVGGVAEWGFSRGVSQPSAVAKTGSFGLSQVGSATKPFIATIVGGLDKTYEVWIYDSMTTSAEHQIAFRLADDIAEVLPMVGVWTETSTTKYVYRLKGGAFVASGITRTLGWHKLSFDVTAAGVAIKIDDVLVATDTTINPNAIKYAGLFSHKSGTSYFDDFRILGSEFVTVQVGTELIP